MNDDSCFDWDAAEEDFGTHQHELLQFTVRIDRGDFDKYLVAYRNIECLPEDTNWDLLDDDMETVSAFQANLTNYLATKYHAVLVAEGYEGQ